MALSSGACIFQRGVCELRAKMMTVQISSNGSGAVYRGAWVGEEYSFATVAILLYFDSYSPRVDSLWLRVGGQTLILGYSPISNTSQLGHMRRRIEHMLDNDGSAILR